MVYCELKEKAEDILSLQACFLKREFYHSNRDETGMPANPYTLLFSPLSLISIADMCMTVGPATGEWTAYEGSHPCEDLDMKENVQHLSFYMCLPHSV